MTREEVISMTLSSGASVGKWGDAVLAADDLQRFAALVAAAEREACAALLEANAKTCNEESTLRLILETNAAAIRARGAA